MLSQWLAPKNMDWFLANHLRRAPYAAPGAAMSALPLCGWETIGRVVASEGPIDLLTVARGQMVEAPRPRTLPDVQRLMAAGVSVVIRGAERHDDGLRGLTDAFGALLPGEVHVQLYATPGGTNSYGWHYDFEDVFIAQTAGVKDYFFRANTVSRDAVLGDPLDFRDVARETSPIYSARLIAGDWLYLPATWWHLVKCAEDALSISVGVMPPEALRRARRLPAGWTGVA